MKKKWQRLFTVVVMVTMIMGLLSGCGSAGQQQTTEQESTQAVSGNDEATTETFSADGLETIQLAQSMTSGDLGKLAEVKEMEKYTEEDVERVNRAIRAYTPAVSDGLLINNAQNFYYYEQLQNPAKSFYEVMYMVAEDPVSADYYISVTLNAPISEQEFTKNYYLAYQALCYDHPELFWLYNGSNAYICAGSQDAKEIFFYMEQPYTNFEKDMKAFNAAADAILSKVDKGASDKDKALQIHDMICQTATYDHVLYDMAMNGTSSDQTKVYSDLAHTAYGVLVGNSRGNKNTAVCDGYSLAYQYLLTQCGIDAVVVSGMAGSDKNSLGGHAWNVVKLDGKWYEVDSTWDDNMLELCESITPDVNGYEYIHEALSDPAYYYRVTHFLFGLSTPRMREYKPEKEDYYITKDGTYQICMTGECYHYRANEAQEQGVTSNLIQTAPIAPDSL